MNRSTGFHISYSEIVITPKLVEISEKDFIKVVQGGVTNLKMIS